VKKRGDRSHTSGARGREPPRGRFSGCWPPWCSSSPACWSLVLLRVVADAWPREAGAGRADAGGARRARSPKRERAASAPPQRRAVPRGYWRACGLSAFRCCVPANACNSATSVTRREARRAPEGRALETVEKVVTRRNRTKSDQSVLRRLTCDILPSSDLAAAIAASPAKKIRSMRSGWYVT
jgi:hypothetical protein